jgi:hypothetical protein
LTAELKSQNFHVRAVHEGTAGTDVMVVEGVERIPAGPRPPVLLLAETGTDGADVVVLGAKPKLQTIRDALRRIVDGGGA